jgi:transcriptional regulator with XRE-family HTH domain
MTGGPDAQRRREAGEFFERQRRRAGLTQDDVAAACHVSRAAVSYWEAGRTPAPPTAWQLICTWDQGLLDAFMTGLLSVGA